LAVTPDPLGALFAELGRLRLLDRVEKELHRRGYALVAGVDEVGRGCLAGPVVAAAVILPEDCVLPGLDDSKKLDAACRERLDAHVRGCAIAVIDAVSIPGLRRPQLPVVHGDALCAAIAAASIVAKVYRDRLLDGLARSYPAYGFERHKGYGTPEHWEALRAAGPCPEHRLTFHGVVRGLSDASAVAPALCGPEVEPEEPAWENAPG